MIDEVNKIMFEHLELLAETAESCEDDDLGTITQAMVSTARFLTELAEKEADK